MAKMAHSPTPALGGQSTAIWAVPPPAPRDGTRRRLRLCGGALLLTATGAVLTTWAVLGARASHTSARLLGSAAGIAPGIWHPYGEVSAHLPQWLRRLWLFAIPVVTGVCAALPWLLPDLYYAHRPKGDARWDLLGIPSGASMAPLAMACVWVNPPPSVYMRDATRCVLSLWLLVVLWMVQTVAIDPLKGRCYEHSACALLQDFYYEFLLHFEGVVVFGWTAHMMVRRYQALADGSYVAAQKAGVFVCLMALTFQAAVWLMTFNEGISAGTTKMLFLPAFAATFQGIWTCYTFLLARIVVKSLALVRREMSKVTGAPRAEAAWACRVLMLELFATPLGLTTPLTWVVACAFDLLRPNGNRAANLAVVNGIAHRVDLFLNAVSIAVLSGLLGQVGKPAMRAADSEGRGAAVREDSVFSASSAESGNDWAKTAEELSLRGVHLRDILKFWVRLLAEPSLMPAFDPRRSTTNDVVRRVIIPMSSGPGDSGASCALASIWSGGEPRPADCMVTHNWSNLFWHLVAGVVADCFGESCYHRVAAQLLTAKGGEDLLRAADAKGLTGRSYWICAFSINQHAGICNCFGPEPPQDSPDYLEWESKRRDTVTQEVFLLCKCNKSKVLNDQPARCEMNKFNLMMRLLSRRERPFCHLVVVDAHFQIFRRAWCVAEIVESAVSGIPRRIILHSQEMLDRHYSSLSTLDVRECRASRTEDRDTILASIRDIDRFNSELQWAIFGTRGLFQKWIDGQERSALVGRIIRRARTTAFIEASEKASGRTTPAEEAPPAEKAANSTSSLGEPPEGGLPEDQTAAVSEDGNGDWGYTPV